jgi:hypothetical protein
MRRLVDADTSSLTLALAGRLTPTAEMFAAAERANELSHALFERTGEALRRRRTRRSPADPQPLMRDMSA